MDLKQKHTSTRDKSYTENNLNQMKMPKNWNSLLSLTIPEQSEVPRKGATEPILYSDGKELLSSKEVLKRWIEN